MSSNAMTVEDLIKELNDSGWTLSWAYQYDKDHWRATIIKEGHWNGYDQPDYHYTDCADAPTLAEAIEDAMTKRNDAIFVEGGKIEHSLEPTTSLIDAIGLRKAAPTKPFPRRI